MAEDKPENGWDALAWMLTALAMVNAIPITVAIWRTMW